MIRVLFVCLGNVCRSPTAEGVFRREVHLAELGGRIEVDSAGTGGHFAGSPPDPRAVRAASRRGIELTGSARQVTPGDLEAFDYILAMDADNLGHLEDLRRAHPQLESASLGLFLGDRSVPDPFYGGEEGFERVLDLLEQGARVWLQSIRDDHQL